MEQQGHFAVSKAALPPKPRAAGTIDSEPGNLQTVLSWNQCAHGARFPSCPGISAHGARFLLEKATGLPTGQETRACLTGVRVDFQTDGCVLPK